MLIFIAYALGVTLTVSSVLFYRYGPSLCGLSDTYSASFNGSLAAEIATPDAIDPGPTFSYVNALMFLQLSNSSAILICPLAFESPTL